MYVESYQYTHLKGCDARGASSSAGAVKSVNALRFPYRERSTLYEAVDLCKEYGRIHQCDPPY